METVDREFGYYPRWKTIIWGGIFFGAAAFVMFNKARHNQRGLIIDHIIPLTPLGATIFYWSLFAASLFAVAAVGALILQRISNKSRIALSAAGITVPKSKFSRDDLFIDYRSIAYVSLIKVRRHLSLKIKHGDGDYSIDAAKFSSKAEFEELSSILDERIARGQRSRGVRRSA